MSVDASTLQGYHLQPGFMKAVVWKGIDHVEVKSVPIPDLIEMTDCIVRVTATTICGSDLHLYHGAIPEMKSGDIIGHEFMGIIERVGTNVHRAKVGDRVVVSAVIAEGTCKFCKSGQFSLCDRTNPSQKMRDLYGGDATAGLFGYSHLTGGYWGGQAQFARVPMADVNTLTVPDSLTDKQALLLSDVLPTGWHGNDLINVGPGDQVAIWGLGPVGLSAVMWAKNRGASHIIGIDSVPSRLSMALKLGASHTINYNENESVVQSLKELCPGGGPNKCIDCVGFRYTKTWTHYALQKMKLETDSPEVATEAILACRKGGSIAFIGDYVGLCHFFPLGAVMEKSLHITGGQLFCQAYWGKLMDKVVKQEIDPTKLFSHAMGLEDVPKAYKMFDNKETLKVFVTPWGPSGSLAYEE